MRNTFSGWGIHKARPTSHVSQRQFYAKSGLSRLKTLLDEGVQIEAADYSVGAMIPCYDSFHITDPKCNRALADAMLALHTTGVFYNGDFEVYPQLVFTFSNGEIERYSLSDYGCGRGRLELKNDSPLWALINQYVQQHAPQMTVATVCRMEDLADDLLAAGNKLAATFDVLRDGIVERHALLRDTYDIQRFMSALLSAEIEEDGEETDLMAPPDKTYSIRLLIPGELFPVEIVLSDDAVLTKWSAHCLKDPQKAHSALREIVAPQFSLQTPDFTQLSGLDLLLAAMETGRTLGEIVWYDDEHDNVCIQDPDDMTELINALRSIRIAGRPNAGPQYPQHGSLHFRFADREDSYCNLDIWNDQLFRGKWIYPLTHSTAFEDLRLAFWKKYARS